VRLIFPTLALLIVTYTAGAKPVHVPAELVQLDISPRVSFRVTSPQENDAEAMRKTPDSEWMSYDDPNLRRVIKNGNVIWARCQLLNSDTTERVVWLSQPLAKLDRFEVWFTPSGNNDVQHLEVGQQIDRKKWPVNTRAQMIPVLLRPDQPVQILVRLAGASRVEAKLTLHEPSAWRAEEMRVGVADAFTYGGIMVMLIYHFMLFFFVRMRGYILYVAYSSLVMLFLARNSGNLTYYFPSYEGVFENFLFKHTVAIAMIMAAIEFGRELLDSAKHTPVLDRMLRATFWSCIALFIAGFIIPWSLRTQIFQLFLLVASFTLMITAARRCLQGYGPGIWYLLSWLSILSSVAILFLANASLIGYGWVLISNKLAVSFEILFLSIALASNFRDQYAKVVHLNKASHRFVPAEFLLKLERHDITEVRVGDRIDRTMTVWFSDLRGFTSLTENLNPTETLGLVNDYLKATEPHITNNGGFIDKYIGDAVMALFDSPQGAIRAAIESAQSLHSMNEANPDRPPLRAGIGLHTGPLVLGTVGSDSRLSCTVLGASVNLASRLEGMTKTFGTTLIISEATREGLDDDENLSIRPLGVISAKGFNKGFALYEVLDLLPETIKVARLKGLKDFENGITAFTHGEFDIARNLFESCMNEDPSDAASSLYNKECQSLETTPLNSWQGILRLTQK